MQKESTMNRLILNTILFLFCTLTVAGMSQFNKDDITIPPDNFIVEIEDIDGVIIRGENVTFDEATTVSVRRGSADVYIPFDKIKSVEPVDNENVITRELKEITVRITLKDGSQLETTGKSHNEITGETEFGRFRIRLDHVRRISVLEQKQVRELSQQ